MHFITGSRFSSVTGQKQASCLCLNGTITVVKV